MSEGNHDVTNNTTKLFLTFTKNIVNSDRFYIRRVGITDRNGIITIYFLIHLIFIFRVNSI